MYFELTAAQISARFYRQPLEGELKQLKQDRDEMPASVWQTIVSLRPDRWAVELAAHPSEAALERTPKPAPPPSPKCTYDFDATPKPRPAFIWAGATPKPPRYEAEEEEYFEEEEHFEEERSEPVGLGFFEPPRHEISRPKEPVGLGFF
ncbi:hypothetical protein AURDEDRAFT_159447 [Auricularia subglabra TFB-10046 SS5]|nr:hypothetical protein AURDEDRAFT_159447 [Auricularia subglabra TFB-10046 SS5]